MEKSEVEKKKQEYLKENIIEKGYNPEELSKYIVKIKGNTGANMAFDQYVAIIEKFKNEQFANALIQANDPNVTNDLKSAEYIYRAYKKEFKCQSPPITPLIALEQKKKKLEIIISDPEKVEGGFFYKPYWTFVINCPILQSEERRTQEDFEWFRNKLEEIYYLNFVPTLTQTVYYKESDNIQNTVNTLQNFFNQICRKKIFRTSELLYNFISLDSKQFTEYKEKINKQNIIPFVNYSTVKGNIVSELNIDKVKFANIIYPNILTALPLYERSFNILNSICENYSSLQNNFMELSKVFEDFGNISKQIKMREVHKKFYAHLKEIFSVMSNSYKSQQNFFNHNLRDLFTRNYNDLKCFERFNTKYRDIKLFYERFHDKLVDKKENLFESKNFPKWELEPNYEVDYMNIEQNKRKIYEKMCYKDNIELESLRMKVGFAVHYIIREYLKVLKYHSERAFDFNQYMEENKKIILGDSFTLIDLFTFKL